MELPVCCTVHLVGECKAFMTEYMNCLKESNYDNYNCRKKAKEYLECRMERCVCMVVIMDHFLYT